MRSYWARVALIQVNWCHIKETVDTDTGRHLCRWRQRLGRCVYEPGMPVPPEAGREGSNRKCQEVRRQIGEHCALGTCQVVYGTWMGWTCLENGCVPQLGRR